MRASLKKSACKNKDGYRVPHYYAAPAPTLC